jgi:hypothetical protein
MLFWVLLALEIDLIRGGGCRCYALVANWWTDKSQ